MALSQYDMNLFFVMLTTITGSAALIVLIVVLLRYRSSVKDSTCYYPNAMENSDIENARIPVSPTEFARGIQFSSTRYHAGTPKLGESLVLDITMMKTAYNSP
uniref:NADH dehydrogenase subunit 3 n=1 Tax=Acrobeloides nanus TaxID=290746 RepID=A0A914E5H1_9BILA